MRYIPRNIARQHTNFCDIRQAGGVELTNDVYARDPTSKACSVFWFVGKVARVSDISLQDCVGRQYPLIQQHAKNLRPLELGIAPSLELWTAPGDSELKIAYNQPDVIMVKIEPRMTREVQTVNKNFVGFQGEVYAQGEEGFRTWRTDDGRAMKPEIIPPNNPETTAASGDMNDPNHKSSSSSKSQEETDRLLKVLDGMDVNELYKEQERRYGRQVED